MGQMLDAEELDDFIRNRMQMQQVYQPAMILTLLENGGAASRTQIARRLLSYDQSQVAYYELRTRDMVGKVLTENGIVEPIKEGRRTVGYRLMISEFTDENVQVLEKACKEKINDYIARHGSSIWAHRSKGSGYISGSVRYKVLSRARYRCELCGAHEKQAALHIDHIIPRNSGGSNDISNLQSLCVTCNTNKRDTDDTDFRGMLDAYKQREDDCIFCSLKPSRIVAENELCFAIRDAFPVTKHHTLVIPKRHVADYFDLYQPERNAIDAMLQLQREKILESDPTVEGFNVGINAGAVSGQTVFHVHVHLIPRRTGDVENPRGGVRGVIPERQAY